MSHVLLELPLLLEWFVLRPAFIVAWYVSSSSAVPLA